VSFLITCPECGERSVYEFRFGGEVLQRPKPGAPAEDWFRYSYVRGNEMGVQTEWWYHRLGCCRWLQALRDTKTNHVVRAYFPGEPQNGEPQDKENEPFGHRKG